MRHFKKLIFNKFNTMSSRSPKSILGNQFNMMLFEKNHFSQTKFETQAVKMNLKKTSEVTHGSYSSLEEK